MQWIAYKDKGLWGYDDQTLYGINSWDMCKAKCLAMTGGPCKSFDIWSNNCYLSVNDRYSVLLSYLATATHGENCDGMSC